MIESPELQQIFLMLHKELKDSNIPHHTTLRNRIAAVVDEHIQLLETEMSVGFPSKYLLWINLILLRSVDLTWIDFMH